MDKLYYVVCEEQDTTLFEGRFQGRTRGAALKFLKEQIGRKSLSGVVFTITEIPVPLIREIVAEILAAGSLTSTPAANVVPLTGTEPAPDVGDPAPAANAAEAKVTPSKAGQTKRAKTTSPSDGKIGNPGFGDDLWKQARAFWDKCHCIRKTAEKFGLSPESVKTRARREGWRK
jgi:hypothetical protein